MTDTFTVLAWDGYPITVNHFIPNISNGKILLLVNGVGEIQSSYKGFSQFFADEGYDVYTFDFRGMGESRSQRLKHIRADVKDWSSLDLDAVISHIENKEGQKRLVIVSHGFGGLLTGFSRMARKADALIFIACQAPHHNNLRGFITNLKYVALAHCLIPAATQLLGYFPASKFALCQDVPANVARQLVEWSRSAKEVGRDMNTPDYGFHTIAQPSLSISFSDDPIATAPAVDDFHKLFTRLQVERWHFTPEQLARKSIGHYGFFRLSMKSLMWSDLRAWIDGALPSSRHKAA